MGSAVAVDEFEVHPQRFLVASQADRELSLHLIEEESLVTLLAHGDSDFLTGERRHEHLWLETGGGDLGRFDDFGWEDPILDQKYIGVEPGTLMSGDHLSDHSEHPNHFTRGEDPFEGNHVVELDVLPLTYPNPELEWGGVSGPEDPADHFIHLWRE